MTDWSAYESELASGEADRVNSVIDDAEAIAAELADLADSPDGKIRESLLHAKQTIKSTGVSMVGELLRGAATEFDS